MATAARSSLPSWASATPGVLDDMSYETIRTVVLDGETVVTRADLRYSLRPAGTREEVLDPAKTNFVGTLLTPPQCQLPQAKCPGLVLWAGSGGTQPIEQANYFVSHGITVLTLLYFTSSETAVKPHLPYFINERPLEVFKTAIDYLKSREDVVDPSRIAIAGGSRGGESALLVAQQYGDSIVGVVAHRPWNYVASSSVGSEIEAELRPETSAWSADGNPLPFVPLASAANPKIGIIRLATLVAPQPPTADGKMVILHRAAFEAATRQASPSTLEAARIKVEDIKVPIFASGTTGDVMWPSDAAVADMDKHRASSASNGRSRDVFYIEPVAGHLTNVPGSPTAESMSSTVPLNFDDTRDAEGKRVGHPTVWLLGGNPSANHRANLHIMTRTIDFLASVYGQRLPFVGP